jgi:hypothetical protein
MASAAPSAEIQGFTAFTIGQTRPASAAYELPPLLHIACSTYNVHSSSISCDLTPWIECHFSGQGPAPDVIVIGMQEITMTPRSLIAEETQEGCDWGALLLRDINACSVRAALHNSFPSPYLCLVSRQLVGMSLYLFVTREAHTFIASASSASLPLGALSMFGNKGAIEARVVIGTYTLQFINCHLAPHPPNVDKRNQQVGVCCNRPCPRPCFPFPLQVQAIFAHFPAADFSLFLGDMNYRVDLPSDRVRSLASSAAYADILAHCQLSKVVQQHGSPFAGFCEAPIHFAPSYSYDPGTDNFDSSAKARIPSYCDRILWRAQIRSGSTSPISCCCSCYTMSSLNASDHKPVVAVLQLCMTHPKPDARASCSVTPVTPMNIGAHGRMLSATQGALSLCIQPRAPYLTLPPSDSDIDRRRLMLARACQRLCDSKYNLSLTPRPLSSPLLDASWRGSQVPALAAQMQDGRWALDESASFCMRCDAAFSALRRRHHCRWCGCVACGSCSLSKRRLPPSDFGGIHAAYKGEQSVCAVCAKLLDRITGKVMELAQA